MRRFIQLLGALLLFLVIVSNVSLNNAYISSYEEASSMLFHTGLTDSSVLYERGTWSSVLPYVRYVKFDGGFAHFNSDGSVTPLLGHAASKEYARIYDVTVEGFRQRFVEVRKVVPEAIPIFELGVIDNVESVNYTQLNTYISGLSSWLGTYNTYGILTLNGEFNFPEDMDGWGYIKNIHGEWINSKVEPSAYVRIMKLAREVLDDGHIKNVLLATHVNLLRNIYTNGKWIEQDWLTEFRGIEEYYKGLSQADVLGFSFYFNSEELDMAWERVRLIRDAVGGEKPILFLEYGNRCWWEPHPICSAEFVNSSYNKLEQYKFVKGISWLLLPKYCGNDTFIAIARNAELWEGK